MKQKNLLEKRIQTYCELSSQLALIKDKDLGLMLKKGSLRSGSWGSNHLIQVAGKKIFVKKIPLTELEHNNSFDTSNLYSLPLYYNYGVGSAGFGAFRELVTHIKTTNWILESKSSSFPLMYHYRIVPRKTSQKKLDPQEQKAYVQRWNNNKAIDRYIKQRHQANHEIIVFLEHFPHTFGSWFIHNTHVIQSASEQLLEAVHFLNSQKILHFDLHLHNIMWDGQTPFIGDFGLALDQDFLRQKKENVFFRQHQSYDFAQLIGSFGSALHFQYISLSKPAQEKLRQHFGVTPEMDWAPRIEMFLKSLDVLKKMDVFDFDQKYFQFLQRYKDVILRSNRFFFEQHRNPKKNTTFER